MQRIVFFLACFLIGFALAAQQYPFIHYSPADGLVNSRVRKAFQDSKGRMFFLTYAGLSMYDGTRFKNYTVENGLANDLVNDILEMGDDSLWIACNLNRLNYLRGGKIKVLNTADGFAPVINKFLKSGDGNLYTVADEGLFVWKQDRFVRLPFTDRDGRDVGNFLFDIIEWGQFFVILSDPALNRSNQGNLYIYDKITQKVIAEEKKEYTYAICLDSNKVYISNIHGIAQLDPSALKHGKIHYLSAPRIYNNQLPVTNYMYFDRQKNFWVYSGLDRIIKIDPGGARKEYTINNGLSSNNFSGIFQDREGSIWVTMHGAGVDKLVNDNIELYENINGFQINTLYTDGFIDSVYMYAGTEKKIITLHRNTRTVHTYDGPNIFPATWDIQLGKIYITDGKNISLLLQTAQPVFKKRILLTDTAGFGRINIDPYNNAVICGHHHLTAIIRDTLIYRYPVNHFMDQVAFDTRNRLWAASRNGELIALQINPDNPKNYFELLKLIRYDKILPSLSARSITVDRFNNVWLGTRHHGLFCFRIDERLNIKSFERFTTKEGLSDNFITFLTCDNNNAIWVSTAGGVDKIRFINDTARIENITRGSHIYEHIFETHVNKSGIAWSLTADGNIIRISGNNDILSAIPSLLITELKIGNSPSDSLSFPASFSYKQNTFSISAAAPSFYDEKQVKYSYWLQGSGNEEWSEPSNNSTFNFINLNPGKYTLKLRATFPAGRYPDQVTDYAFVIHPPWWQTWWFRIGIGLLGIAILLAGFRLYYRRKLEKQKIGLEKQQAVEKERTRIATDIHDDLGSGLSRIRYLGEMVKLKTEQQKDILPDIEKISVFSDEMVDKMNEIVWALNEKNDTLEAMISYTRSFAVEYLSGNNLQCQVRLPEQIPFYILKGETRRNIFLSVKESLHNIVKHAGATTTIISIDVNHHLLIGIRDNGKGIDWEKIRPFSNGLSNIKKRMKEAGGTVEFSIDEGTTVILKVPLV